MTCPICGKTHLEQKNWIECPKYKGAVCDTHCKQCKLFTDFGGFSLSHCRYFDLIDKKEE